MRRWGECSARVYARLAIHLHCARWPGSALERGGDAAVHPAPDRLRRAGWANRAIVTPGDPVRCPAVRSSTGHIRRPLRSGYPGHSNDSWLPRSGGAIGRRGRREVLLRLYQPALMELHLVIRPCDLLLLSLYWSVPGSLYYSI